MEVVAILPCAGQGVRFAYARNKLFYRVNGKPILQHTLDRLALSGAVHCFVLAVSEADRARAEKLDFHGIRHLLVTGGATRTASVLAGLEAAPPRSLVLIHDGARPFPSDEVIRGCIRSVRQHGSGIAAVPCADTLKRAENGKITEDLSRENVFQIQTPQGFWREEILAALRRFPGQSFPDESSVYTAAGLPVYLSPGSPFNQKITVKEDLKYFLSEKKKT